MELERVQRALSESEDEMTRLMAETERHAGVYRSPISVLRAELEAVGATVHSANVRSPVRDTLRPEMRLALDLV